MSPRPTIIDIAKRSGFSKTTVSQAFRGGQGIAASTRGTIQRVAKELGYSPNLQARSMRTSTSKMIGFLAPDSLNPFYTEILQQTESLLLHNGYDTVFCDTHQDPDAERHALERMQDRQVDGIIIGSVMYDQITDILQTYQDRNIHCVVAGAPHKSIPFDCVAVDLCTATQTATEHLIELGHRQFAFIQGAIAAQQVGDRLSTFRTTLHHHEIPLNDDVIYNCGSSLKDGYEAGKYLLSMRPRPTAVFALNDILAIGVMRAAKDLGLRIPEDVSVVGVDNIELSSYIQPSLSTIAQPIDKIAKALTELMLGGLSRKEKSVPRRINLSPSFLARESTGSAPTSKSINS